MPAGLRVHVARPLEAAAEAALRAALRAPLTLTQGPQAPAACDVLVAGRPTAEQLDAPGLRWVLIPFAGLPAQARELLRERPGLAVHNLHFNAAATAEMALALLLAAAKRLVPADRALRAGDWGPRYDAMPALQLAGATVGVLGYGAIGRRVARACAALGMRVLAVRRRPRAAGEPPEPAHEVHGVADLPRVLPRCQALVLCLPETPATRGLVDAAALAALPRGAVLVNVGRGPLVDAAALHAALVEGRLFAAGLDVWWRYPADEASRGSTPPAAEDFGALDSVVLSPHRGGTVLDTEVRRAEALAEVLDLAAAGQPLPHRVDLEAGY